jgi:hypothetical protein
VSEPPRSGRAIEATAFGESAEFPLLKIQSDSPKTQTPSTLISPSSSRSRPKRGAKEI